MTKAIENGAFTDNKNFNYKTCILDSILLLKMPL